jgi:predicted transcriptional regulator
MAHAYTPGLKVLPLTLIRKKRVLPIPGKVLVEKGKVVDALDVVAEAELPGKVYSVNVANRLGCAPSEVRKYLLKKEGDNVVKGEIIAETKSFIKFLRSKVESPTTGKIESISDITGQVLFRDPPKILPLKAYINGKVVEVIENFGVEIETEGTFIQGIFGIGGETNGEIRVAVDTPQEELLPEMIKDSDKGKIIIGGKHAGLETIKKAIKVGVHAIVVGGIHDSDLRKILGYDIGVAVTGTENIGITLIVTEGFGQIRMAEYTFKLLKAREGEKASVSGATQIRAGVMRPEIIICGAPKNLDVKRKDETRTWMEVGDKVRIIREPYFGLIGKVSALPPNPTEIPTESKVRILEVELETGEKVIVPRANVEILDT